MKLKRFSPINKNVVLLLFLFFLVPQADAQSTGEPETNVVDQIAGIVGSNIVLQSEIETQYTQFIQQGNYSFPDLRCRILDQLLLNKLLLNQANLDSLTVGDDQVNGKIDNNLSYYIQQIGSVEKLEQFYGKSIAELKEEFKPLVRDQLLAQQMQSTITKNITASPLDVKQFYDEIPKDSLPLMNVEVEYAQIVHNIPISAEEKAKAKEQLKSLRERIINGEDFGTLALLYSADKESAKQNGDIGFVNRGDLVPAFEAVAFRLKNKTEISEIVETQFGYHIVQLIERRGEKINVRHILIKPNTTPEDITKAQQLMDSVAIAIRDGKLTFALAAEKFSDDTDSKLNAGVVANPASGAVRFESDQVDPTVLFQLDKMNEGEISSPSLISTKDGGQGYRILLLKKRTEPHKMNLNDDYQKLQELALNDKQQKAIEVWRNKKKKLTYIRIADAYKTCEALKDWNN
ncbi:peptidylprolyl isomerase [soil metagenome]